MSNFARLEQQKLDTREIISALLEDGSDPDALYAIEHHLSGDRLAEVEPAMQAAFKLGYEIYEPEAMEMEDGTPVICFDVVTEIPLSAEAIDEQTEQLMKLADEYQIYYDGWGTYFESEDGDEEIDDDDDDDDIRYLNEIDEDEE